MKDVVEEFNSAATKIQAFWRGFRARKNLLEIQKWYKETVLEIEGEEYDVYFPQSISVVKRPRINDVDLTDTAASSIASSIPELLSSNHEDTENITELDVTSPEAVTKKPKASKKTLLDQKRDVAMELFWVQQAIESRRNYLLLKNDLQT